MKKSKEYAVEILAFYNSNMHKEDLKKLVMDYVVKEVFAKLTDEMQEIAKARNCNNDICLEAIIHEQIDKWKIFKHHHPYAGTWQHLSLNGPKLYLSQLQVRAT